MDGAAPTLLARRSNEDGAGQMVRYVLVGGCGYVLAMAIYAGEIAAGVPAFAAVIPAFVLNGLFNFIMNRWWSFPASRRAIGEELLRFGVVALASLAANVAVFFGLHVLVGLAAVPAQALTIVIVVPFGFFGNKLWTFDAA
jgi:putative flippase GtrA